MKAVKQERRHRSASPLIQVKEETWSPPGEHAYYTQAQEPTEEGETSEVGETTSEEDHEDDADKRRRRKTRKKSRPKRRRSEELYRSESEDDSPCPCPRKAPQALGLQHVPKQPSPEVKLVPRPNA